MNAWLNQARTVEHFIQVVYLFYTGAQRHFQSTGQEWQETFLQGVELVDQFVGRANRVDLVFTDNQQVVNKRPTA